MGSILGGGSKAPDVPSPEEQRQELLKTKKSERAAIRNQSLRAQQRRGTRSLLNPGLGVPGKTTTGVSE